MNLSRILIFLLISVAAISCRTKSITDEKSEPHSDKTPYDYVNTFIGTAPLLDTAIIGYTPPENWRVWAGLTYPGAALPNAMVQVSPITEFGSGAGYEYEDEEILGFTHTNKGHWNLCNIPVLPVTTDATFPYKSKFQHKNEVASPGYYQVELDDYDVEVKLTSTLRTAFHQYNFGDKKNKSIMFYLGKANNNVSDWKIEKENATAVSGYQRVGGDKVHFYAELSSEFGTIEKVDEGKREGYALIKLKNDENIVDLKIGLSYVSIKNAKENLEQEIGDKDFAQIFAEAKIFWSDFLGKIKVEGGNEKQKQLFYSSLYRTFLWPALRSDHNGEFKDEAGEIKNEGFRYYTNPSFWDTYRNKLVLLQIMRPEVTSDIIKSLINRGEITGFIPTFFHGDHAAAFIAGSYERGIRDFDVEKAYELLLNNAYKEGGPRPHILEYIEKGYISEKKIENPNTETVGSAGVSKTLEYSYDDYALSLLAENMGDAEKAEELKKRGQNFSNVFDKNTNFMRGKLQDGNWVQPFNAEYPYYEYMYREANAWQLSFYVPHDMPELVNLYGSEQKFEEKLDSLFSFKWNPKHIARNVSGFIGQYSHGNQPDHEAPFSYYFIDKPEKSQAIIDKILEEYYGIGKEGLALSGMDDAGEMSAWYVCSALGMYPFSPSDPEYLVSVPLFDKISWELNSGNILEIQKNGNSRNLESIHVDDKAIKGYFVPHSLFTSGGKISINTK